MRVNLIPLAGNGQRFINQGYLLPKPLIPVLGKPMLIRAIEDLPPADKWIFVVKKEHIEKYAIDRIIHDEIPGAEIIALEESTLGPACTCMYAKQHISPDDSLLISGCDIGFLYDEDKFNRLTNDAYFDSVFWTFTKREALKKSPADFGYCICEKDGMTVNDVSVKKPISANPYYDHAIVSTFFFKHAKDFFDAADMMIRKKCLFNSEFYIDAIPKFLAELKKRTALFDVDLFVCFGTPDSLHEYELLANMASIESNIGLMKFSGLSEEQKRLLPLIRSYLLRNQSKQHMM